MIGANSVIHENTIIGKNVVVMPNVIIGGDGFQYVKTTSDFRKQVLKVKSAGKVIIEDNVEILSGTCVERGVFNNATVIGKDTKINHLVLIGHDSKIGERCLIVGSAMVSGRVTIGDDAWIGPNSTLTLSLLNL